MVHGVLEAVLVARALYRFSSVEGRAVFLSETHPG
jgi:hypothetical protein